MLYTWNTTSPPVRRPDQEFSIWSVNKEAVLWLDLNGDEAGLREELQYLGISDNILHALTVERLFVNEPRAFLDEYDEYIHLLIYEVFYNEEYEIETIPCHFIIGSNYLLTIHQRIPTPFAPYFRETPPGRFFSQGSDVLFFYLADMLISGGFLVLDEIADLTENLADRVFPGPDRKLLNELFDVKKDLIAFRKLIVPMREITANLARRENSFVDEKALPFINHLYDQLIRIHETIDSEREIISEALDIYLSSLSHRTNEIVMTLTIVSTIILPMTLIVGFYGMNFRFFPELNWHYGIVYVLSLMLVITGGMLWYFKRKKWF